MKFVGRNTWLTHILIATDFSSVQCPRQTSLDDNIEMESDDAPGVVGGSVVDAEDFWMEEPMGKQSATKRMKTSPIQSFGSGGNRGGGSASDESEGEEDDELEDDAEDLEDEVCENSLWERKMTHVAH